MGHDQQRAGPRIEEVLQGGQRLHIEVIRRLVEQQDVRLFHEQSQELQTAPLTAGELTHGGPTPLTYKAESLN